MPPNEQTVYPSAIWQMVSVSYLKPAGSVTVSYLQAPWRPALGHLDSSDIDYWSAPVTSSAKSYIILMIKCALICLIIRFVFNMCLVWWSITMVQSKISQHAVEGLCEYFTNSLNWQMKNPADCGELHIFLWHHHEADICGFKSQVSTTVGWITVNFCTHI